MMRGRVLWRRLWTQLPQATRLAAVIAPFAIAIAPFAIATATIWAVATDTDLFPTPPGHVVTSTISADPDESVDRP